MRILQILMNLDYGGAEKVGLDIITNLQGKGFEFSVCVLEKTGPLEKELPEGVRVECLNRAKGVDLGLLFRLRKIIKEIKPDIIHMHNVAPLFYGVIGGMFLKGTKFVLTQHGSYKNSRKMDLFLPVLSKYLDKAIAISNNTKEYLKNIYKIDAREIGLIINGIDDNKFRKNDNLRTEARKKLNINDNEFVIGHIARLSSEKAQKKLLEAFAKLSARMNNVKLVIIGDGPLRVKLERLSVRLDIADKTDFLGSQSNMQFYLNAFDVFVLSSIREGLPLTVLEAMAVELAIVSTNVGGIPDVVSNDIGILVSPDDIDGMSNAIERLINNKELRLSMGKAGRKKIEKEYSLDRMVEMYKEVYCQVVG